jgi:hypothetical protein
VQGIDEVLQFVFGHGSDRGVSKSHADRITGRRSP